MKLVNLIPLKEMYNPAEAFNKKVSRMTNNNDHSSAAVELAIYLDDRSAVNKLQQIKKQHDKDGIISPEAAKKRDKMVDDLLKKAKKELTNKDYQLVSDSF
jgi:outer membrane protein assembly factor BamE (lipoprotein component of BamABCDE complex)